MYFELRLFHRINQVYRKVTYNTVDCCIINLASKYVSTWLFYGALTAKAIGANTRCRQFRIVPRTHKD